MNKFEELLKETPDEGFRNRAREVTDTMHLVRVWCETYQVPFTAADLVAGAAAIEQVAVTAILQEISDGIHQLAQAHESVSEDVDRMVTGEDSGRGHLRIYNIGD